MTIVDLATRETIAVGAPIVTWWVSGPIMAACAGVAAWGFLPLVTDNIPWPIIGATKIPLHVAARKIYEAAEKANVLDLMISQDSSAEIKLNHFKMLMMVDDRVRLFGMQPPSTKSRLLPKDELKGELYPSEGETSELQHLVPGKDVAFTNVTVPRKDLRFIIKIYLSEYVDEMKLLRAGIFCLEREKFRILCMAQGIKI